MSIASIKLIICLKIGCPTNFISVFLLMLEVFNAKTNLQHGGETLREYPLFYYFSRSVVFYYEKPLINPMAKNNINPVDFQTTGSKLK